MTKIPQSPRIAVNKPSCKANPSQWQSSLMTVTAASVLQWGPVGAGAQAGQAAGTWSCRPGWRPQEGHSPDGPCSPWPRRTRAPSQPHESTAETVSLIGVSKILSKERKLPVAAGMDSPRVVLGRPPVTLPSLSGARLLSEAPKSGLRAALSISPLHICFPESVSWLWPGHLPRGS